MNDSLRQLSHGPNTTPIAVRPAVQPMRQQGGRLYGIELLARRAAAREGEGAGPVLSLLHEPVDWMQLDVTMLREAASHALTQTRPTLVFVNLSEATAANPLTRDRYLTAAEGCAAALPPGRLVVEINENLTASVGDLDALIAALRERNMAVAMDDFHASAECWRKVRANWDCIKIDCARLSLDEAQRALRDLTEHPNPDCSPVLIAEAVATDAVREAMFAAGAYAVQGWISGPPRFLEGG
ncbi:EAL domain-containing protein [Modicisalibacter sp. MOD 31.J]|uniref:EAL domain-containing protein n=1 Tax=Modicisalibacter sp. MOD 31.J TaxID=2831897 RepID=UPI001CD001BF|nr:EAL domain-containing protein [Modicisalibacter sp. MOD 31.J]MBZ9574515.1 EAL domain-containing protein [Modicisalibacter sp. MOD 31.J]